MTADDIEQHWLVRFLRRPLWWTCFHCGETFYREASARDHFGTDQYEYIEPGCVERLTTSEKELRRAVIEANEQTHAARCEAEEAEIDGDNLRAMEAELARRFNGARSVQQAWFELDSMEGRAIAAEAIVAAAEQIAPDVVARAQEVVCSPITRHSSPVTAPEAPP